MPTMLPRVSLRAELRATAVYEFIDPLSDGLALVLFSAVDENAVPREGDHVIVSDGKDRYRQRYQPGMPLPPFHEIQGVSRAIIIPE